MQRVADSRVVEGTATGERVTLRAPGGSVRYFLIAFLLFSLCGWAAGLAVATITVRHAVLSYTMGRMTPGRIDPLHPLALAIELAIVGWIALWTWGGITAIGQILQLLFGYDAFSLRTDGWQLIHHSGLFTRTREFRAADGWVATLRRRRNELVATRGHTSRSLTRLGTEADRRWLRDELSRRYAPGALPLPPLPKGLEAVEAEGGLVVRHSRQAQLRTAGYGFMLLLGWNVPLALSASKQLARGGELGAGHMAMAVVGALLALAGIWVLLARSETYVAQNVLEERTRVLFFAHRRTFRNAALAVECSTDGDNDEHFALKVEEPGRRARTLRRSLYEPDELVALAHLYARQTGWRLTIAREAQ